MSSDHTPTPVPTDRHPTTAIAARLRATDDGTADSLTLAARVVAMLCDVAFLHEQVADPDARLAEAREALAALESEASAAWHRYPAVGRGGFHGGQPDRRPLALAWVVRFVQEAAVYRPDELAAMLREGTITPTWAAAEAVRFSAFLAALHEPLEAMLAGHIQQPDLAARAEAIARTLAAVRLPPT